MAQASADERAPEPRRSYVLHAWLSAETYTVIAAAAARRGVHVDRYAARLLEGIAEQATFSPFDGSAQ